MTEYASGGSLRDRLKQQAPHLLPQELVLIILSQVGQALQYAHQHNIVHRDLKPENILFNSQEEALLADFGIATMLTTGSMKYLTVIGGTPPYMAPEQFRGNVGKESDQYALACIAYELLTGRPPFSAPDFVSMGFKHCTEDPLAPRQLNPQLPLHIEHAILQALAKQRGDRYPDVVTFIAALSSVPFASQEYSTLPQEENIPTIASVRSSRDTPAQTLSATQSEPVSPIIAQPPSSSSQGEKVPHFDSHHSTGIKTEGVFSASREQQVDRETSPHSHRKKTRAAHVTGYQIVAMILGPFAFAILYLLSFHNNALVAFTRISNGTESTLFFSVAVPFVLFCGVFFGPWVGSFIGGLGFLFADFTFVFYYSEFYKPGLWILHAGIILGGWIAGLPWLKTRGRYSTLSTGLLGAGCFFFGLVMVIIANSLSLKVLASTYEQYYASQAFGDMLPPVRDFVQYSFQNLMLAFPGFIFLPIFLFVSTKTSTILKRSRR